MLRLSILEVGTCRYFLLELDGSDVARRVTIVETITRGDDNKFSL